MNAVELLDFKKSIDLSAVIKRYITPEIQGKNYWKAKCPFHKDDTPSFCVWEGNQNWFCFGCRKRGDAINFIMEYEGVGFKKAIKIINGNEIRISNTKRIEQETLKIKEDNIKRQEIIEVFNNRHESQAKEYKITLELKANDLRGGMLRRSLENLQALDVVFVDRFIESLWETDFEFDNKGDWNKKKDFDYRNDYDESREIYFKSCDAIYEVDIPKIEDHKMRVCKEIVILDKNEIAFSKWQDLKSKWDIVDLRQVLSCECLIECDLNWNFLVNMLLNEIFDYLRGKYPDALIFLTKHGNADKNMHIHFISMRLNDIVEVKELIKNHYAFDKQMLYSSHLTRCWRYHKLYKRTKNTNDISYCSAFKDFTGMKVVKSGKDVVFPFITITNM